MALLPVSALATNPFGVTPSLAIFGLPGGMEWIIILVIGLLLFGRRLPEVGRSLGQGIVEFKKGLKGVGDEIENASNEPSKAQKRINDQSTDAAARRIETHQDAGKVS